MLVWSPCDQECADAGTGADGYGGGMASHHFRAGVVVVVRHPSLRTILVFERADNPDSWQLPQGGLKVGETPEQAAWREMEEETGLTAADVIARAEYPEWLAYEWPADVQRDQGGVHQRIGQVQRWFLFDALSPDVEPTPDGREFVAWRWVEPEWLVEHVAPWRRPPYERVLRTL